MIVNFTGMSTCTWIIQKLLSITCCCSMVYMERKMTLIISTALIIMFTSFTKKSGRSAGWLYLSELGSLVSGMGDNQVISSTCCVKIITAQGATTKTPHQQLSDCEAWRKNRLWQQQSNKIKIRKSITNKKCILWCV